MLDRGVQMKTIEQYLHEVLIILLTRSLKQLHLWQKPTLSCYAVCLVVQSGSNFMSVDVICYTLLKVILTFSVDEPPVCDYSNEKN